MGLTEPGEQVAFRGKTRLQVAVGTRAPSPRLRKAAVTGPKPSVAPFRVRTTTVAAEKEQAAVAELPIATRPVRRIGLGKLEVVAEARAPDEAPPTPAAQAAPVAAPRVTILAEGPPHAAPQGGVVDHGAARSPAGQRPRGHETPPAPGVRAVPPRQATPEAAREAANVVNIPRRERVREAYARARG